jgi:hypothetical protein
MEPDSSKPLVQMDELRSGGSYFFSKRPVTDRGMILCPISANRMQNKVAPHVSPGESGQMQPLVVHA